MFSKSLLISLLRYLLISRTFSYVKFRSVASVVNPSCTVLWDDSEKVVPAKGHDYNTEYTQDKEKHYHECKNCDAKKDEAAHDFTTLTPEVAATCTTKGVKAYYYCSICDAYADETKNIVSKDDLDLPIDPNAHQYGDWVDEVDPTATELDRKSVV